ncbi:MAG TPA: hypothetical protein VIL99_12970 [Ignavibacteria bacterium]|jgi:hypothetical protein
MHKRVIKKAPVDVIDKNKDFLIEELLEVFHKVNYTVRIEKGFFKGGFCLLREQKLFLLNKNLSQDKKILFLVKNLAEIGVDDIFLKPNIREMIDNEKGS